MRKSVASGCRVAAAVFLVACGVGSVGATGADLARAADVSSDGRTAFVHDCASCHGKHGEGLSDAPAILGPGALPEYERDHPASGVPGVQDPQQMEIATQTKRTGSGLRGPFHNALDLYSFLSTHVSSSKNTIAKPQRDWAIVTFLLAAQGAALPPGGVTAENAPSIAVPHR